MTPNQFELHAQIEDFHWWFVGRRRIVESVVCSICSNSESEALVDIGCGTGGNIGIFRDRFNCAGLDVSYHAVEFAKKRFPGTRFICSGLEKSTSRIIGNADILLLLDVLEHIEDDSAFMYDLAGNMKQGAQLLITVPADMSLWSPHDERHGHFRRYSKRELRKKFEQLPLKIRLLSYYNTFLYPVVKTIRVFTNMRGKPWGKAGTDLSMPPKPINLFLAKLFSSESRWLLQLVDQPNKTGLPFGVSIISLLEKL